MTYIFNSPIFNIKAPIFYANKEVSFLGKPQDKHDAFTTNPLYDNALSQNRILAIAKNSPRIIEILKEYKIPLNVNIEELEKLKQGHLKDTRILVANIYSSLPPDLKQEVNLSDLQQAAMLHDIGKVLIPNKILNKEGSLNDTERKIIEQHSELGYEILKQQGLNQNVLSLIKYHHQLPDKSGYPAVNDNFEYGISNQILACADKYSALREKRSYKNAMTKDEALDILKHDVEQGILSDEIYNSLSKST